MTGGDGMTTVTKEEFYQAIYQANLDVHPYPERDIMYWRNPRTRALVGTSTPGYLCVGAVSHKLATWLTKKKET